MATAESGSKPKELWSKTIYANMVRYEPSGIYFSRIRVRGKLIRRSLKTNAISVAKLRLADLEKIERQRAENQDPVLNGTLKFANARLTFEERIKNKAGLKPRSKAFRLERIAALLKSWPSLDNLDIDKITKKDCQDWHDRYSTQAGPQSVNTALATLRMIIDLGVEAGARYDNPARFPKKLKVPQKKLKLPEQEEFPRLVKAIQDVNRRFSKDCADLVCFLAFGGFRKGEATHITWADCDLKKKAITVRGDPETGTKGNEPRQVPMIPDMVKLLERLRADRPKEEPSARVMQVRECQGAMTTACEKLGIARITHHDLRHLFATRCIESGVDIPTVSRWLGHKDGGALAMKVYGHLRNQHSTEMAQRVSFNPKNPQPKPNPDFGGN